MNKWKNRGSAAERNGALPLVSKQVGNSKAFPNAVKKRKNN